MKYNSIEKILHATVYYFNGYDILEYIIKEVRYTWQGKTVLLKRIGGSDIITRKLCRDLKGNYLVCDIDYLANLKEENFYYFNKNKCIQIKKDSDNRKKRDKIKQLQEELNNLINNK